MPRDYKIYISDIIGSINKIEHYTKNMSFQDFLDNELVQDGVIRNLEIIGEAVKKIRTVLKGRNLISNGKRWPVLEMF